ncbi:hypothetical protein VCHA53O466_40327 [Vibrio chagasii]|nr:hypothetical protein VCHA53O466_40327 [Vibrio chagasii]
MNFYEKLELAVKAELRKNSVLVARKSVGFLIQDSLGVKLKVNGGSVYPISPDVQKMFMASLIENGGHVENKLVQKGKLSEYKLGDPLHHVCAFVSPSESVNALREHAIKLCASSQSDIHAKNDLRV